MRTLFNGVLFLFLSLQIVLAKDYLGAELRTKEDFVYGRFEINYKSAAGTGVLSNFFVYHDFTTSTADWNEIDIEILSRYDDDIQCTTIVPRQFIHNSHTKLPFNPHEDFYSYAFEWTPDYVAWFVEGKEIYRQTGEHIQTLTRPSKIMMNLWADDGDGTWTGPWIPETLPYFAYYDWVAYYEWTPDSGNAGTDDNFTFRWRDDFAEWDTVRWEKATHTWGGNRVQFTPDNAVFEDGKLILCLTEAENSGYTDVQAPSIIWARAENNTVHVQFSEKVDSLSALDKSKYSIPGAVIDSVIFDQYKRSVLLKVTGLDAEKEYSLVLFGLSDLRGNVQSYSFKEIIMQEPLSFPVKINVGGESIYNGEWLPDQKWAHDVEYGRMDGYDDEYPSSIDIANTEMDSVYLQGVHEINRYRIRVPDGIYSTTLHFTENKFSAPGDRAFDINIEDEVVLTQLMYMQKQGSIPPMM